MRKVVREILSSRSGRLSSKRVAGFIVLFLAIALTIVVFFAELKTSRDLVEIIKTLFLFSGGLFGTGVVDNILTGARNKMETQ